MNTQPPEVADVFRCHVDSYLQTYGCSMSKEQRKVIKDITSCRTATLGGHLSRCEQCGHQEIYYNSCRNRHCPKCQAAARAQWLQDRAEELLDVPYFHVVFTLPDMLGPIMLQNKRVIYGILFRAASETLHTIARDPKHLGAQIGFIAILHTWGQTMQHHPHLHCVVPGGGISYDGKRWISSRKDFFVPVRVLSCLFQKKFLAYLDEAYKRGSLSFYGKCEELSDRSTWKQFISSLYDLQWVVYSKQPFGSPKQVLKYLARYTHRVAIANQRLISLENGKVTFKWKDYSDGNKEKTMLLDAVEFIRRFLLHVIPSGFMRIRHYGFLSNRCRKQKLTLCRKVIDDNEETLQSLSSVKTTKIDIVQISTFPICPSCKQGRMVIVKCIEPKSEWSSACTAFEAYDTS
jgi:hypothetical protein